MRILQITKKVPYPLKDGESIAVTQLAKGLIKLGCKIDLLSFNQIKYNIDIGAIGDGLSHYGTVDTVFLDNRVKIVPAFINLFTSQSYNITRFIDSDFKKRLGILLRQNKYDIILIESLFMTPYIDDIKKDSNAKIVMRSHNIEYQIWDRLAKGEKHIMKKWYLNLLTRRLKKFEDSMMEKYDLLVPISHIDADYFASRVVGDKILSIPTGMNTASYIYNNTPDRNPIRFFFLGSLDWKPNIEGLEWFLNDVWTKNDFNAKFYIAGRNCPDWLIQSDYKNVEVLGEIDDAHQYIRDNDIMIVPLFSGSGIRIKILESMALGKIVVSSSIGIEGIRANPNKEFILANTKEEYEHAINELVKKKYDLNKMRDDAHSFLYAHFDNDKLSELLLMKLNSLN